MVFDLHFSGFMVYKSRRTSPQVAAWPAVNAPVPIPQPVRGHFASCYERPAFTMAGQFCRCQGVPAVPLQLMGGFP